MHLAESTDAKPTDMKGQLYSETHLQTEAEARSIWET